MVQASIPDLNSFWGIAKKDALMCLKNRDYQGCTSSLYDMNALLPNDKEDNYQIEISDIKYYEKLRQDIIYVCSHCEKECLHCTKKMGECKAEVPKSMARIKIIDNDDFIKTLTGLKTEKVWTCPKCNNNNLLSKTKMIQTVLKEPFFLGVVPHPPQRKDGILDRREFHKKYRNWAQLMKNEISYSLGRLRRNYKPKDGDEGLEAIPDGQEHLDEFT